MRKASDAEMEKQRIQLAAIKVGALNTACLGFDSDGHRLRRPQTMTMMATTMTATNHDDQLGEVYPMMLNELNCTFGVSFHVFIAMAVVIMCSLMCKLVLLCWNVLTWFSRKFSKKPLCSKPLNMADRDGDNLWHPCRQLLAADGREKGRRIRSCYKTSVPML